MEEYHFCTLVNLDFSESDAFILAYQPPISNPTRIKEMARNLMATQPVKIYLSYLAKVKNYEQDEKKKKMNKLRKQIEEEVRASMGIGCSQQVAEGSPAPLSQNRNSNRTKEDIISELNAELATQEDPKIRLDIYKQLADLQGMKKEQEKDDDNTIHYYFPLNCKMCGLYQKAEEEEKNELKAKSQVTP